LAFGGEAPGGNTSLTETWNGSGWTEVGDLNANTRHAGNAGTATSALAVGGLGPPTNMAINQSWNGTSWTEVGDLNTARRGLKGFGADNTSAVVAGGYISAYQTVTETWNGSSWSETNDLNTARGFGGSSIQGTIAAGIVFAGEKASPSPGAQTEDWNGASWSEVADLNTGRGNGMYGHGTATLGLAAGGETATAVSASTEEWSQGNTIKTVDTD
jgi:hypothetical protein